MKLVAAIRQLYVGFFPKRIQLSVDDALLLAQMYPTVDWNYVRFFDGMPWYMRHTFAIATALPSGYDLKHVHIYFRTYKPEDFYDLITLVHEAYHVLQYQELRKGVGGWGFFRSFIWHYIGWYFSLFIGNYLKGKKSISKAAFEAYRYHPLERPAYDHEEQFANTYTDYTQKSNLESYLSKYPELVRRHSGYGNSRPPYWALIPSFFLAALITVLKPIVEFSILFVLIPIIGLVGKKSILVPKTKKSQEE